MRALNLTGAILLVVAVVGGCSGDSGSDPSSSLTLTVLPPDTTIAVTQGATYSVVALDENGDTLPTPPVDWTSSDTSIATIDTNGVATGLRAGTTNIVATSGQVSSAPAVLHVAATAADCFGIASATRFAGTMAWGFKVVNAPTDGGFLISADDNGSLSAVMVRQPLGGTIALWTADVAGSASVTQKKDDGTTVQTYNSTSGTIVPQPVIGMPKLSLLVDLQACTYKVVSGASVATVLKDPFGNLINSVDIVAQAQFTGAVPSDWRIAGISHANGAIPAHSVLWLGLNLTSSGLAPLGFATELFEGSPSEPSVGQGSGGFSLTYQP